MSYATHNQISALDLAWRILLQGSDRPAILETLRNLFPDTNYIESRGFSKLHRIVLGILHCDLRMELAKDDVDINVQDVEGRSPLSLAAWRGDTATVDILLNAQAQVNIRDHSCKSPLLWALQAPTPTCAKLLLQYDADATVVNNNGQDALYFASYYFDDEALIQSLLKSGADVNRISGRGGSTIANAARHGYLRSAKALLDGGANVDILDHEGDSPLMEALLRGQTEAARFLLERGANVTRTNMFGESILHYIAKGSCDLEDIENLETFMLTGVDPDAVQRDGKTALQLAQQNLSKPERFVEQFETLLDGIRTRNRAGSSRRVDRSLHETPGGSQQSMDPDASVLTPRGVAYIQIPLWSSVRWLKGFRRRTAGVASQSIKPTFWFHLLLGLGWAAFFGLLLRSSGTDTQVSQPARPSEIYEKVFTRTEAAHPPPALDRNIAAARAAESFLQRLDRDSRRTYGEHDDGE